MVLQPRWSLYAIPGLVSLIVGVLVLTHPDPSIKLLGVFLGIDLLIVGVLAIVRGASNDTHPDAGPGAILLGILALIAGLLVIRNPQKSLTLLAMAFGIYLVAAGAYLLGRGMVNREGRFGRLARGALMVAAGTVIISWPDIGPKTLALIAGITLVLQGVLEIAMAFLARRAERDEVTGRPAPT